MIPQRLDADTHGRLIVLAGLTDIRSDTLGLMLSTHSIEFLWNALRGGRVVEFARRSGNVLPLPAARAQQCEAGQQHRGFEHRPQRSQHRAGH